MTAVFSHLRAMLAAMALALPAWLLLRGLWLFGRKMRPDWRRELLLALFGLCLFGLFSQTLTLQFGISPWAEALSRWENRYAVNLVPFATIRAMLTHGGTGQKLINLAGNVLIFVPLGLLPPLLWPRLRHLWAALLIGLSTSCLIEFLQLFLSRSVDVDDVLLNVLGCLLGWLLAQLSLKLRKKT